MSVSKVKIPLVNVVMLDFIADHSNQMGNYYFVSVSIELQQLHTFSVITSSLSVLF